MLRGSRQLVTRKLATSPTSPRGSYGETGPSGIWALLDTHEVYAYPKFKDGYFYHYFAKCSICNRFFWIHKTDLTNMRNYASDPTRGLASLPEDWLGQLHGEEERNREIGRQFPPFGSKWRKWLHLMHRYIDDMSLRTAYTFDTVAVVTWQN